MVSPSAKKKKSRVEAAPRGASKGSTKAKKRQAERKKKKAIRFSLFPPRVVAPGPYWPLRAPRHSAASVILPMRPRENGEKVTGANEWRLKRCSLFCFSSRSGDDSGSRRRRTSASIFFLSYLEHRGGTEDGDHLAGVGGGFGDGGGEGGGLGGGAVEEGGG